MLSQIEERLTLATRDDAKQNNLQFILCHRSNENPIDTYI
jgi:hypothetical protein